MLTVIGEWVFIQNAVIDFGLLAAAARLARLRVRTGWLCLAALLGGGYAVLALYIQVGVLSLAFPIIMTTIAMAGCQKDALAKQADAGSKQMLAPFSQAAKTPMPFNREPPPTTTFKALQRRLNGGRRSIWRRLNLGRRLAFAAWFFAAAGGLSGITFGLGFLFGPGGWLGQVYVMPSVSMWFLTLAMLICGIWLRAAQGRRVLAVQDQFCGRLCIRHGGVSCTVAALVDTGCTLREPCDGRAAAIICQSALQAAFGEALTDLPTRQIPYNTLGGSGTLPCFAPDSMVLMMNQKIYPCDGYVAIGSQTDFGRDIAAIVPLGMIA